VATKRFTRMHYTEIAKALAAAADERKDLIGRSDLAELVDRFVALFERDNDNFQADRFRKAVWRDGQ
jgi:hypothetical protein